MASQTDYAKPGRGEFDDVADYYDLLMRTVPYNRWVDYIESILRRWEAHPTFVLDLACGTGKVGSEMADRGFIVRGADLSEPMVRHCMTQQPPLPAIVSDASNLALRSETFDLIVSLYDSLNYILDPHALASCFRDAWRVLKSGGLFIFDLNTERALATGLFTQDNMYTSEQLQYSWEAHWDRTTRICRVDMLYFYNGVENGPRQFRETHYQRAYEHEAVLAMLKMAGFVKLEAYSAYSFRVVTPRSDRAYYVARKE